MVVGWRGGHKYMYVCMYVFSALHPASLSELELELTQPYEMGNVDGGSNGRSMFHYDGAKIETDCMGCCATNTASLRWVIHVSSVMKPDSISTGWSSAKSAWMEQKAARKVDDDTHHNAKNISHTSLSMSQE
ncbi:uncharacterized protein BO96DRAFT_351821 [Aspergillus niger CBS 101883]|uniref:Contig An02c0270, genomic contig n=2 Tax=Aspergillus niger TaxID=5061 RepID=A2QDX7_ASPNC|nr:uncharacterized protein BO96DRAFT_351821 [Aspergillus niger CBS 101883]XP_059603423.1 uncharacterized protein An02g08650 [Aspergillus niger]PYH50780.1 hypothetical protein BO96DRAFT_351821 [Aspergillus niger CBS 101883]CAK44273.1 unnamed protein product [Aspergillus niger]